MEQFIKSRYAVYTFFLLTSVFGWLTASYEKGRLKKFNPITMVFFDTIIATFVLGSILISQYRRKPQKTIREFTKLSFDDTWKLTTLGILGTLIGVIASNLLKYHDVSDMEMSGFMISLFVSGIAIYLLAEKEFTISRFMGFILLIIGGYLFMK